MPNSSAKRLRQPAHVGGKVVSPTHRPPLPPGNILGTHFCQRLSRPQGHSAAGRMKSMKNSNDTIGNRSRDLPVFSAVPQPLRHREVGSGSYLNYVFRNLPPLYQVTWCRVTGMSGMTSRQYGWRVMCHLKCLEPKGQVQHQCEGFCSLI
jgi:hypothetical protein